MEKQKVRDIIEKTVKSGSKFPSLFDLPKLMGVKSKLESCSSINDVIELLEENRGLVCTVFSLGNDAFDQSVAKIRALDVAA
jgi:hypothetical protein